MSDKFDSAIREIVKEHETLKGRYVKLEKENMELQGRVKKLEKDNKSLEIMVSELAHCEATSTTYIDQQNEARKRQNVECTSSQTSQGKRKKMSDKAVEDNDPFFDFVMQPHSESESIRSSEGESEDDYEGHKSSPRPGQSEIGIAELQLPYKLTPVTKADDDANRCTSPCYNSQIPTQYSENSSPVKPSNIESSIEMSKLKSEVIKKEPVAPEEVIEDSEDETNSLIFVKSSPLKEITNKRDVKRLKPHTTLQKRSQIIEYYTDKFHKDNKYKIDLSANPITESNWVLNDFKPNPHYCKPKTTNKIPYSRQQQQAMDAFYKLANTGLPNLRHPDYDLPESQVLDKFPSPPGFMVSDFPTTQEQQQRKEFIKERQADRLKRRLNSCLTVKQRDAPIQIGEFIFVHDILNHYVISNRYKTS